jgi:diphthamide synthase subunit DPH2
MSGDSFSTGIINETDIYLILELEKPETYLFIGNTVLHPLHLNTAARNNAIHYNFTTKIFHKNLNKIKHVIKLGDIMKPIV